MCNRRPFLLLLLFSLAGMVAAQQEQYEELLQKYPFVRADTTASCLIRPEALQVYYTRLRDLEKTGHGRVVVAHVGDSHVQAGFFSEPLRRLLQKRFGFAGRGLLFPYQAAGTNGPPDYSITSAPGGKWKAKRNSYGGAVMPTGVAGHTIHTRDLSLPLQVRFKDLIPGEFLPDRLLIFHASRADSNVTYAILDTAGRTAARADEQVMSPFPGISAFRFDSVRQRFRIAAQPGSGRSSTIFGLSAENDTSGVLFHTIGVNGAEYRHYLKSELFNGQLAFLSPHLIVISLGTNEAYNVKDFDSTLFYRQADSLVAQLQQLNPGVTVLLTTPPDIGKAVRKGRRVSYYTSHPQIPVIREVLLRLAANRNLAVWDFYTVMGGKGSITQWHKAGLMDARRIHFNRTGYYMEGYLLWKALDESYRSFVSLSESAE